MCGIAGVVDFDQRVDAQRIHPMTDAIAHRGPDGAGHWADVDVVLGHRRLAIVDVAHGVQPVFNEDNSVCVVFNGEIYNHRDLRKHLSAKGHRFRTHCDAEILPHLYEEYGTDLVDHLDGVFGIALWDSRRRTLLLTRDPVGVKPLFLSIRGRRLVFASEIKGIFASGLCDMEMDRQGLSDCFFYGHTVPPRSFWKDVEDLEPGTLLEFGPHGVGRRRYFTPLERKDPERPRLEGREGIEAFRHGFIEAIRKRLPDEVTAGIALSGGLDSAAVAAAAARNCGAPLPTSSIRLPGSLFDEPLSEYVSKSLSLENTEVPVTADDACALLPRVLWHVESPQWFGPVATPFYKLAQSARSQGFKVALTGDGADELLGGYDFYRLLELNRRFSGWSGRLLQPHLLRHASKWIGAPTGLIDHILRLNKRVPEFVAEYGACPAWIYWWTCLHEAGASVLRGQDLPAPSRLPPPPMQDGFRQSLHFEYSTRLPAWILGLSDRLSMAHGIEVRVPFLDRDLLRIAAEISPDLFTRWSFEKYILRVAMRKELPKRVRWRRKKPFFTPIASWYLSGPGQELAGSYLSEDAARTHGVFDPKATEATWRRALEADGTWPGMLAQWVCLMVMSTHILLEQFPRKPSLAG
jgi:asparagine synthase (glutamine-hydrolysing)